jgi:hypothetical protein
LRTWGRLRRRCDMASRTAHICDVALLTHASSPRCSVQR